MQAGKKRGPLTDAQLKQMAASGQLKPTDMIWKEGMAEWVPAEKLKGLFAAPAAASAPAPPPDQEGFPASSGPAYAPQSRKGNIFVDYLSFRRMITPVIIQIVFWAGAVLLIFLGLYQIIDGFIPQERGLTRFGGRQPEKTGDVVQIAVGFVTMLAGPFVLRIYCELLILFFRMNETLTEIKNSVERPDSLPD